MIPSNTFVKSIHLIVATVLLTIVLRTWVVMGLVAPVTVSGSSMVPALRGEYVTPACPRCEKAFDVGGEYAARSDFATCPRCAEPLVPLADLPLEAGDRLWIDRTVFDRRSPRRWEVVVSHCPHDAEQLCVKRVVGLPGESVEILQGDVLVDGKVLRKSLAEQFVMRQIVHVAEGTRARWQPQDGAAWQWRENRWQCQVVEAGAEHWLRYRHLQGKPVTDDSSYNAGVSRRLNRVRDFLLGGKLRMKGDGALAVEIADGGQVCRVTVRPAERAVWFEVAGQVLKSGRLSDSICGRLLAGEGVELVFSNFDRQLLLALDGEIALECPLPEGYSSGGGVAEPVAVGAVSMGTGGGGVSLEGLTLYRDVYYEGVRVGDLDCVAIRLGEEEYYLLGDNAPISVDSRRWGPVPGRLLIGKPLGVR